MPHSLSDQQFLEMRWRCLSLAADLDRAQRADREVLRDPRIAALRKSIKVLLTDDANRAEQVQMLFSGAGVSPAHNRVSESKP